MASMIVLLQMIKTPKQRRPSLFRDRSNVLDTLDDVDMMSRYRFPRHVIFELCRMLDPHLNKPTRRSHAIPPSLQVLCTLRYLAKGTFLSEIGDLHGVSRASVSTILRDTSSALVESLDLIKFPTETRSVMEQFHDNMRVSPCNRCVDGTLIPIQAPKKDEVAYIGRMGYHCINVQAVSGAKMRFNNTVILWPGSTYDSHIFNNSEIKNFLEESKQKGWMLGDSGYACKSYLLAHCPLLIERYNRTLCGTCNVIERPLEFVNPDSGASTGPVAAYCSSLRMYYCDNCLLPAT